jgi:hypothetical protein
MKGFLRTGLVVVLGIVAASFLLQHLRKAPTQPGIAGENAPVARTAGTETARAHSIKRAAAQPFGIERRWIQDGALAKSAINDLEEPKFDAMLSRLDQENSAKHFDRTIRYRELVEEMLSESEAFGRIDRMACGPLVCMVSIETNAHEGEDVPWLSRFWTTAKAMDLELGGLIKSYQARPDGTATLRLLFTTHAPEPAK